MVEGLNIVAMIDGHRVSRREVREWEAGRAAKVCEKLGITPPAKTLGGRRDALVARKLELGHEELEHRLARELWSNVESGRCPQAIEKLLTTYLEHRAAPGETFLDFTSRLEIASLKALCGESAP